MYIFDKTITKYTKKNHVSLVVVVHGGTGSLDLSLPSLAEQLPSMTLPLLPSAL